jgi:hypothetical protein
VRRVAGALGALAFERLIDNFGGTLPSGASDVVQRSADRYIGWVRGDFDDLT